MKKLSALLFCLLLTHCARSPIQTREEALRYDGSFEETLVADQIDSLLTATERQIEQFTKYPQGSMTFGERQISREDYLKSLLLFKKWTKQLKQKKITEAQWELKLKSHFDFYEVYGDKKWSDVFVTSYFQPIIRGSLKKTKKYSEPLYEFPKDLVYIDLNQFIDDEKELKKLNQVRFSAKVSDQTLMTGAKLLVPYDTREEIHSDRHYRKRSKVIAWVDPIEAFFLQIQGSGIIQIGKKRISVGYAGQNGHEYVPIGKFLLDSIPLEKMSLQAIEGHLRSLPKEEIQEILNKNPSFVYFKKTEVEAPTYHGPPATGLRTIATDERFFPKGALALLKVDTPEFSDSNSTEPLGWVHRSLLVFDQDRGGAIRGPGRVDLFYGKGKKARQKAGVMKQRAQLWYLLPKETDK